MPTSTDTPQSPPVVLFLMAHQDDEFGVFQSLTCELQQGAHVRVAYLTSGVPPGQSPTGRNEESRRVLKRLGINAADILFAGASLGIADGSMLRAMPAAMAWLHGELKAWRPARVYVPAWEGGHPDHDALHAATVMAGAGWEGQLLQFPLYNAFRCPGPLFRVMSPLASNGPVRSVRIPWLNRFRFIQHCLSYPSQARTWIGLLPFAALHYVFTGVEQVQPVAPERLRDRPHAGPLYYERRRFATWHEVEQAVDACRKLVTGVAT